MKTPAPAAAYVGVLLLFCRLASGEPPVPPSDVDTAWKQLQQAAVLAVQQKADEQAAAAALAASEKASSFYTQFPGSSNVLAARIIECNMLQTAKTSMRSPQPSPTPLATPPMSPMTTMPEKQTTQIGAEYRFTYLYHSGGC